MKSTDQPTEILPNRLRGISPAQCEAIPRSSDYSGEPNHRHDRRFNCIQRESPGRAAWSLTTGQSASPNQPSRSRAGAFGRGEIGCCPIVQEMQIPHPFSSCAHDCERFGMTGFCFTGKSGIGAYVWRLTKADSSRRMCGLGNMLRKPLGMTRSLEFVESHVSGMRRDGQLGTTEVVPLPIADGGRGRPPHTCVCARPTRLVTLSSPIHSGDPD